MQNLLTVETKKYAIKIENFEGPLDLLCHLIEKNKMDIADVRLSDITEQYVEYIHEMEKMNLEIASEFLFMASTLVYLKSKKLLPSKEEQEEEITEEELIRRIIEYKKYKEITKKFKELFDENSKHVYGKRENISLPKQQLEEKIYSSELISNAYSKMVNVSKNRLNTNAKNIEKIAITETYTVGSKVKDIFKALFRQKSFEFNSLFSKKECSKPEIVTAFNGLLELSRRNKVCTSQEDVFGEIIVEKKNKVV